MPPFESQPASRAVAATPFADLNSLLDAFLAGVEGALGDNLVGVYLQGSFALGDFDAHSDVDFIVVTRRDIATAELPALQALHHDLHARPTPWAPRLEGSYVPAEVLRRWSTAPRDPPDAPPRPADWADPGTSGTPPRAYPFWFIGNGERDLVRSEHDNTQVVRWVLRQAGLALVGPPPAGLIDPIDPDDLRADARHVLDLWRDWLQRRPDEIADPAIRAFMVLGLCRILQTLRTATITSKKTAAAWAQVALDRRWRGLIAAAWAARRDGAGGDAPGLTVAASREFMAYAIAFAERPRADPLAKLRRSGAAPEKTPRALPPSHPTPGDRGKPRGLDRHGRPPPPPTRPARRRV